MIRPQKRKNINKYDIELKNIASLWETSTGDISIGGISEKEIPLEHINEMIAYVSQDNYLFDDTMNL